MRRELPRTVLATLAVLIALPTAAESENQSIEALIASVGGLTDATFVRNGGSYDAASAARFLREKWRSRRDEVRTAEEFIERVASASSTTGRPYLVRFADGRELPSAEFLRARLAEMRAGRP